MTVGVLRVSAIALSAVAFVLSSPVPAANAATVTHHYRHAAHPRVAHGVHGYVAHGHAGHRHYVWRNGHRYAYYGYNPGAAVAAGVIAGAEAGYPYCGDYNYVPYYGSCDDYSYRYPYPDYDYGYGFGGPVFFGRGRFHHRFDHGFHRGFAFHGDGAHFGHTGFGGGQFGGGHFGHMGGFGGGHFAGGNFGHTGGFGGGQFGGGHFAGGNFGHMGGFGGGFGGGHMGGFGGGHFGGGHFR
jgi:hypothetical protein